MSDASDLEHVLRLARKYGARRICVGDIDVEMLPLPAAEPATPLESHEAIGAAAGRPTDDELLMWSAPQPSEEEPKP